MAKKSKKLKRPKKGLSPRRVHDQRHASGSVVPRLTLRQLAMLTPPEVRQRGPSVFCTPTEVRVDADDIGIYKLVRANTLAETVVHATTIQLYHHVGDPPADESLEDLLKMQQGPALWKAPVWVSCNCEYFLFNCEVAIHRWNSTDIVYSNGAYPSVTNPQMIPHLCKHLYALAPLAVSITKTPTAGKKTKKVPHPHHKGSLPKSLLQLLQTQQLTPTEDEINEGLRQVRNFL